MGILQNIFEITNIDNHKVITLLGIKFKLNRTKNKDNKPYIFEHIFCFVVSKLAKVKKNKIVFINFINWQYADNQKYLAEELLKRDTSNLDLVWFYNKGTNKKLIPNQFRKVDYPSLKALYEFMTAGVWVINANPFLMLKKGAKKLKGTLCMQTWHGTMGIKQESANASKAYENLGWTKWQKLSASCYDYIFTDSEFEKKKYETAFWGYGEILKLGIPRDKYFFNNNIDFSKKIKEYYNIPQSNKILLYAPTWRVDKRCNVYNIDIKLLKKSLNERFGGEWSILIRSHVQMRKDIFNALYDKNEIINVAKYHDMQELLLSSDALITDYSSCLSEYTILKKPSFIYATDIQDYEQGLAYPMSDLPSPLATDNGELAENILNFDEQKFKQKADEFLSKMGFQDDENSAKRIIDFILNKMEQNK